MVAAGDVALLYFPFSRSENPPYKKRPCLVLNAFGAPPDEVVWVVMITGNDRRVARPGPGDIVIPDWQAIPLATSSVLRTRRVWTAETRDILRVLGAVPDDLLDRARELVRESIGNSGA